MLPPAPPLLFEHGARVPSGAFLGSFARVNLESLTGGSPLGRLRRLVRLKRWQYVSLATPDVLFGCAIVNAGYAGNGFAFAVDLAAGGVLVERSFLGIPGLWVEVSDLPGEGSLARFAAPGGSMRLERRAGETAYRLEVASGHLAVQALLESAEAPPPLAVVHPWDAGRVNCTQKTGLLAVTGMLHVGDRRWDLRGALANIDYTHGLLPRTTAWRWASGHGRAKDGTAVGFNLSEGWCTPSVACENAVWAGRETGPLPEVRFAFDAARPMQDWSIASADGKVDLRFHARGLHREERNLVAIRSRFVQVAGTFAGRVAGPDGRAHEFDALPGVVEDQFVVW